MKLLLHYPCCILLIATASASMGSAAEPDEDSRLSLQDYCFRVAERAFESKRITEMAIGYAECDIIPRGE